MAEQYIVGVGAVIASLLGFLFLYCNSLTKFRGLRKLKRAATPKGNSVNKTGNSEGVGTTDIIIVGAGVAGAALAYSLGKDGRRVQVIERDLNTPNRIVGEVLLPGGYIKLIELGLEDCVDEIDAQQFLGYSLYKNGKETPISYPMEKFQSHISGRTSHNGRFVQRLRKKAASLHNVTLEQGTVTSLIEENGIVKGVHYKNESGQVLTAYAPLTIVCDGCFSNLRRSLCYPKVDIPSYLVALTLTNCSLPKKNYGAIILAHPSPIIWYPISSTEIRCMVNVPSEKVPSVSNGDMACYLKTLVAPKVFPEVYNSFISAIEKKGKIRIMPTKIMAAAPHLTPGALLIGDALNMRHPITGGGMTVALSDVVILRDLLRPLHDLSDAFTISKYLESFYTLRKPMSSTINILANVLQKVFSASSNPAMENMQHTFLGYLRLGGVFSYGISAMLFGLCPRPLSIAFHFFSIAIYGIGRLLLPFPSPKRLWDGAEFLWLASSILLPYIYSEGIRQTFFPLTVPAYYRAPPENEDKKNFMH
ncbi:hypothetical protein ERO13_A04G128124v2 [Gossypium hirsutum]|uniref:Squalene monooxygenase n=1 Tax=Gossypium hirsutum TaxID=3635 RepID=A0A1U8M819_GOSHI|nr:squalene monooxygenase SE1-like [Gossypium hirsutum]KAG4205881.1 hypothetical protein ERO13_A04G128124v2 [Gossypium hirsutum]